jgi:hypothetical protein
MEQRSRYAANTPHRFAVRAIDLLQSYSSAWMFWR